MKYWLFKSEPLTYGIDHLKRDKTTPWEGVRNYQARNYMWKEMKKGDLILFYHSSTAVPAVVGIAKVSKEAHPDMTQCDPKSDYYDPKATIDAPRWFCVDVTFVKKFKNILSLTEIKNNPVLKNMRVAEQGSRLSITPVSEKEYMTITTLLS